MYLFQQKLLGWVALLCVVALANSVKLDVDPNDRAALLVSLDRALEAGDVSKHDLVVSVLVAAEGAGTKREMRCSSALDIVNAASNVCEGKLRAGAPAPCGFDACGSAALPPGATITLAGAELLVPYYDQGVDLGAPRVVAPEIDPTREAAVRRAYAAALVDHQEATARVEAAAVDARTTLDTLELREGLSAMRVAAARDAVTSWQAANGDLEKYTKEVCKEIVIHPPVVKLPKYVPSKQEEPTIIPGKPPVYIPGTPGSWSQGRQGYWTPGFYTPAVKPVYTPGTPPKVIPGQMPKLIPGNFTPGFIIPGEVKPGFIEKKCPPLYGDGFIPPEIIVTP